MARTKKETPVVTEVVNTQEKNIIFVMDRVTKNVISIDANKEKDWKTKYLHRSGVEFE